MIWHDGGTTAWLKQYLSDQRAIVKDIKKYGDRKASQFKRLK